jgi:hypothetical protein
MTACRNPPHRARLLRWSLVAVSTVSALLAAEVGLRISFHLHRRAAFARYADHGGPGIAASDVPGLFYAGCPGVGGANSRGFLDDEHALEKDPDVFRVVVIGDSVVAGHGVGWQRSFGKLLERRLNQPPRRRSVEVILLACSGYSTCQELVLLRNDAFRYRPDLILWSYVLNDPAHPIYHPVNGDLSLVCEPKVHLARLFVAGWFHLRETFLGWGGPEEFHVRLHYIYWNQVEAEVGEIGRLCREQGVPAVFAIHPVFAEKMLSEDSSILALEESLKDLAARNDLTPVALREAYRGHEREEIGFPSDPWHPNAFGHRLLAEYLDRWMRRQSPHPARPDAAW